MSLIKCYKKTPRSLLYTQAVLLPYTLISMASLHFVKNLD